MNINKGNKNDNNKIRWDLLPIKPIEEVVEILTQGAKEYGEYNWKKVKPFNERYYAALMRHLVQWRKGETIDLKSGKKHLAHAICNLIFLLEGGE